MMSPGDMKLSLGLHGVPAAGGGVQEDVDEVVVEQVHLLFVCLLSLHHMSLVVCLCLSSSRFACGRGASREVIVDYVTRIKCVSIIV